MKRSTPLQRKKPLNRGSWSRKNAPLPEPSPQRKRIRTRPHRPTVAEGSKYLDACRGEPCYLRVRGVCRFDPTDETVVPCHENSSSAGKGLGIKARHDRTVPGCFWCHVWLDQGPAESARKAGVFLSAFNAWVPVRDRKMGLEAACAL